MDVAAIAAERVGGLDMALLHKAIVHAPSGDEFYFLSLDGETWFEMTGLPVAEEEPRIAADLQVQVDAAKPDHAATVRHLRLRWATRGLQNISARDGWALTVLRPEEAVQPAA